MGYGVMGEAFALSLAQVYPDIRLLIAEKSAERAGAAGSLKNGTLLEPAGVYAESDIVLLAVKPQDMDSLLSGIGTIRDKPVISIAAGKPLAYFEQKLNTRNAARFMPNVAASIRKASVAVSFGGKAEEEFKTSVLAVARAVGTPWEIPESMMAAFTGLSGSGIAYVCSMVNAMALGGVSSGMPYPKALAIVLETLESAAAMLRNSPEGPAALITRVASPAGTTIAGIETLERAGFTGIVMEAVKKTAQRAGELEG